MIYNIGTRDSYDGWANLTGDPNWIFDSFLPFFAWGIKYSGTGSNTLRAENASFLEPEEYAVDSTGARYIFHFQTLQPRFLLLPKRHSKSSASQKFRVSSVVSYSALSITCLPSIRRAGQETAPRNSSCKTLSRSNGPIWRFTHIRLQPGFFSTRQPTNPVQLECNQELAVHLHEVLLQTRKWLSVLVLFNHHNFSWLQALVLDQFWRNTT